ncbi:MAG: peptide MFS transporter [bacterium]|nr:peptide MFS transporter [bacterium]
MSDTQNNSAPAPAPDKKKQPKGLYILFGTEAWERFSYYGMRAILVLYLCDAVMNGGKAYSRADALALYGIYTGLVYLTPMIGGYLADRFLGARKAIIIGGITMALGELCMAFPALLYPALALLIIGNGFFKPNISNIVGGLYDDNDPRRDGGFTIFYMGINLGAFFSPLVCGTLASMYGYRWGFIAACLGMVIGQIIFNLGFKHYGLTGYPPDMKYVKPGTPLRFKDWFDIFAYIAAIGAIIAASIFIGKAAVPNNINAPLPIAVAIFALAAVALSFTSKKNSGSPVPSASQAAIEAATAAPAGSSKMVLGFTVEEWQRIAVIVILSCFVIFFWMGFEQAGGSMTLFAEQKTDRAVGSFTIPASYFQAVNPFIICTFAPLFSMMWYAWDNSKYKISTPYKMVIGLFFLSLGFVVMYIADGRVVLDSAGNVSQGVSPWWLASVYFLHTMGELCLSPVGLSMVTKLSPQRIMSVMMGFWFLSSAAANYMAGMLETLLSSTGMNMWHFLILSSAGAGVFLLCLCPILKKWMHGRA